MRSNSRVYRSLRYHVGSSAIALPIRAPGATRTANYMRYRDRDPASPADASDLKGLRGWRRVIRAGGYSWAGLRAAYAGEAAFRQLLLLNAVLVLLALRLDFTGVERALLFAVSMLSLVVELLNSAIEAAMDRISLDLHPLAGRAKDMGSAAQSVALLMILGVWLLLLLR